MALDPGNLAENIRRLAGVHLVSLSMLAEYIGVSRPAMHAIVAHDRAERASPRAQTAIRLAQAFGISLNALYSDPKTCLAEAIEHLDTAPITEFVRRASPEWDAGRRAADERDSS